MDAVLSKKLKDFGKVRNNVEISKFTTFKVGGLVDIMLEVTEKENLIKTLNFLTGEGVPYIIIGGGSNLLMPDEGYEGVVIKNKLEKIKTNNLTITAESGVVFSVLLQKSLTLGLAGLEWAAGLPGTVGGAVRGNAGAAGGETAKVLHEVLVWLDGELVKYSPDECGFGYRESVFKHNKAVIIEATFELFAGDRKNSILKIQEILKKRVGFYPPFPSAGSFFKNPAVKKWTKETAGMPENFIANGYIPAGWLNEQAGLKGYRVGGAMVSEQHGNFIINRENAKQADVQRVVDEVKSRVYNKFGIELEEEVQIIH